MQTLIFIIIFSLLAYYLGKPIKKYATALYVIFTGIAVLSYLSHSLINPINSGHLGLALLLIVMFQGALSNKNILYRKYLYLRKEYSILGFILLVPHCLIFIVGPNQMIEWNGTLAFLIMIPLFVTSFIIIRKKIKPDNWKKLHALSYIVYTLIFVHLIVMSLGIDRIVYFVLFIAYISLKLKNRGFYRLTSTTAKIALACVFISILIINCISLYSSNSYSPITNNYTDGIYRGIGNGFRGEKVIVDVTIVDGVLSTIDILEDGSIPHDDMDYGEAVHILSKDIINENSLNIDAVSGATKSSNGLKEAVNNALESATQE